MNLPVGKRKIEYKLVDPKSVKLETPECTIWPTEKVTGS